MSRLQNHLEVVQVEWSVSDADGHGCHGYHVANGGGAGTSASSWGHSVKQISDKLVLKVYVYTYAKH